MIKVLNHCRLLALWPWPETRSDLLLNFDVASILNIVKFLAYTKIHIYKKNEAVWSRCG